MPKSPGIDQAGSAQTRETSSAPALFPRAAFLGVLVATFVTIGVLSRSSLRSLATIQSLEENELAIERVCGEIVHFDEVLTMSARMAAATGDLGWEERYLKFVPRLDDALARAGSLAPVEEESEGNSQTKDANDRLIAMETQAFDLVRAGESEAAAKLLGGEAYAADKVIYAAGNQQNLDSMRARTTEILEQQRVQARREQALLILLVAAIVAMWIRVGLAITTHVRERRDAEDLLRRQARALEEKNEEAMEAAAIKSQFLARMSHEIRTPMNGVLGIADVLAQTELSEDQSQLVETISNSGNLLQSILNDVLDFSKIEAGMLSVSPEPCDLESIARNVCLTLGPRARVKGVELREKLAEELPAVAILDPVRTLQILLNLVGNAIKFTSEGFVELRVTPDEMQGHVRFEVEDSGMGIEPEHLSHIFDGFVQADDSVGKRFGGTGLGLTICRELARLMGGTLETSSVVGEGSTFALTLPIGLGTQFTKAASVREKQAEPKAALPQTTPAAPVVDDPAQQRFSARVLVAEDNQVNQLVARRMLERFGCEVELCNDGQECLDQLERNSYDLILMDLGMPRMSGIDATAEIRKREGSSSRTPIVAFTASAFPGDVEACNAADMDGFISKPVRPGALLETLERFCRPALEKVASDAIASGEAKAN